jgi:hypothetical protein
MKIFNLIQESNVDGEIIVNVIPCASVELAQKAMDDEIATLISNSPKYKNLNIDNPSDDFIVERCEGHTFIKIVNDDYYEEFKIDEKEIVGSKRIYLVDAENTAEEKGFYEMTDEEVKNAAFSSYDSMEGFIMDFNADKLDSGTTFAKLI